MPRPKLSEVVMKNNVWKRDTTENDTSKIRPSADTAIRLPNTNRKKDLVKLQFGEYIALGKVEAELKTYPLIENICVFGNGLHTYLIALIVPNPMHLKSLAKELGKVNVSFQEMCSDEEVAAEAAQKNSRFWQKMWARWL
ncbi:long-chain-fatty-acid--CoA ligase 3 [Trichonephila clavipes]|uniref:Long-chain-fatty-acid--CoA ligase 3 n=1 Tax=Trichonephila clavipes TaxID=2585209 RepID=A0A8X6SDI1_TRICX|nr:long-chain-fatty-acid--CoA ligase 3 [Trichonephila clavipes]